MKLIAKAVMALALGASISLHAGPGLIKAATSGDIDTVKQLLAAGEGINEPGKNGWTPLMWAVWYRQLPVTELLLAKGADPNLQSTDSYKAYPKGTTALNIALHDGLEDQALALVKQHTKGTMADSAGITAIDYARKGEYFSVLSAMGVAVNSQLEEILQRVSSGADVNAIDVKGWTPLLWAVHFKDQFTTERLLAKGADPNLQATSANEACPKGVTPLILASRHGSRDLVATLVKNKARLDLVDASGNTAEAYARKSEDIEVLRGMGIRVALNRQLEELVAGIEKGKDPNTIDNSGWTPLMWSVSFRDVESTEYLLSKGANPDLRSTCAHKPYPEGVTALIIAANEGLADQAAALLKKKANIKLSDATGKTAESYAYQNSFYDVLDLMMDRTPLNKPFPNLLISEFKSAIPLSNKYAFVLSECQASVLETLTGSKGFEKIDMAKPGDTGGASTLLLKAEIIQIHIPNGAARFFVGPLAGRTNMDVKVTLVDAATGKVEREQVVSSANSIWLSSLTLGVTDQNFAKDTGAIIAGYVLALVGKAPPPVEAEAPLKITVTPTGPVAEYAAQKLPKCPTYEDPSFKLSMLQEHRLAVWPLLKIGLDRDTDELATKDYGSKGKFQDAISEKLATRLYGIAPANSMGVNDVRKALAADDTKQWLDAAQVIPGGDLNLPASTNPIAIGFEAVTKRPDFQGVRYAILPRVFYARRITTALGVGAASYTDSVTKSSLQIAIIDLTQNRIVWSGAFTASASSNLMKATALHQNEDELMSNLENAIHGSK